jgi:Fe(3+) dicitrate transport protein
VPGIRFEYIENEAKGYINTTSSAGLIDSKKTRSLFLYGIGSEFKITENTNLYSNYSLAYRPVTFSELTPSATTEVIDPNLKDANGFNFDFGYRGSLKKIFSFDIGVFYLNYKNKIGLITLNNNPFKTNIGNSVNKGIESFVEVDIVRLFTPSSRFGNLSIFASNSLIDAKYVTWNNPAIANDPAKSIANKRVENAPTFIHRFGLSYYLKGLSATYQISYVSDVFTDASNTETPNAIATVGKLNGYKIMDFSLSYNFSKRYSIKGSVNNISNEKYATRRAGGYPGPGILPGNGRTFSLSFGVKI